MQDPSTLINKATGTAPRLLAVDAPNSALAAVCYVSDCMVDQETDAIFRSYWFAVGRSDIVARPGAYITLDIADQSIILLRDRNGVLRAFANACRHRGARLVEGQGRCTALRCPFHSWMFHLDGSLAAAPHMDEVDGFDRDDHALTSYRVAERLGFVFVCLNPYAPDIDVQLGNFADLHAPWPLDRLKTLRRREMVVGCNWKAFLEVFNEYYHLPFVHPDTVNDIYQKPDPADHATGAFASQFGGTDGTGGLLQTEQDKALPAMHGLTGQATRGVRYSWVFPNMSFAASSDAMWMYEAYPMGPDTCRVVQTACFPPETLDADGMEPKLTAYLDRLDAAIEEDIPALENQQRGLKCADAQPSLLHPLLEANVAAFANWYANAMTPSERSST